MASSALITSGVLRTEVLGLASPLPTAPRWPGLQPRPWDGGGFLQADPGPPPPKKNPAGAPLPESAVTPPVPVGPITRPHPYPAEHLPPTAHRSALLPPPTTEEAEGPQTRPGHGVRAAPGRRDPEKACLDVDQ